MLNKVFPIINEALGRKTATKGKVTYLNSNGDKSAPLLTDPDEVKQKADNHGTRAHGPKDGVPRANKQILRDIWPEQPTPCDTGDGLATAMSWDTFRAALYKFTADKAVGIDGWNAYLLRRAPAPVHKRYWDLLCTCVEKEEFPMAWSGVNG